MTHRTAFFEPYTTTPMRRSLIQEAVTKNGTLGTSIRSLPMPHGMLIEGTAERRP